MTTWDDLGHYDLQMIGQSLVDQGIYQELCVLMRTSRRFYQSCQPVLQELRQREINRPPDRTTEKGDQEWMDQKGQRHRRFDLPAVIEADGTRFWYVHGQRHRDGDQPAIIGPDGTQQWYVNGELHRDGDQPAMIGADGTRAWYVHGKEHREGDQPAFIGADGTIYVLFQNL